MCGKVIRPNKDVVNRIKDAFEAPKAPYYTHLRLSQEVVDAVRARGSNITTRLETHRGVLPKVEGHLPQSGTDGNVMKSTGNLRSHIIGRTHGSGIWITSRSSTLATMHRNGREKGM